MLAPAQPMIPRLEPGGFMVLTPVQQMPAPSPPRIPGDILLPDSPAVDQAVVWIFPQLAQTPLNPTVIRNCLVHCWDWAIGSAAHRAAIATMTNDLNRWEADSLAVGAQLRQLADQAVDGPTMAAPLLAAHLDQHADSFGPATATQFEAIRWGRQAEFNLASAVGEEVWKADTQLRARYSSWAAMASLDYTFFAQRAQHQVEFYTRHAYDIAATWRGEMTIADLEHQAARSRRNAAVKKGAQVSFRAVGAGIGAIGDWREARAAGRYRAAKTAYLNRSARNYRY